MMAITAFEADVAEAMEDLRVLVTRCRLIANERWNNAGYYDEYYPGGTGVVDAIGVMNGATMGNAITAMQSLIALYDNGGSDNADGVAADALKLVTAVNIAAELAPPSILTPTP